jgi:iron complex transport system substrate-binding protein
MKNWFIVFFLTLMVAACNSNHKGKSINGITITDMLGREVVIPSKVNRVIGLRAGALRLLAYMDAINLVVGVEDSEKKGSKPYLAIHPQLMELPSIGPSMGGDPELILYVKPDVIFITYTTIEDANALQKKTGVPVIALDCKDLNDKSETLFQSLRIIGKVIANEARADQLISYIKSNLNILHERTISIPDSDKPSVYVGGISYSGAYGIKSTHPSYAPFEFINANNVASRIDKKITSHVKGTFIDIEQLILWNPDFIFIDESGKNLVEQDLAQYKHLTSLKAVKQGSMIYLLPYNNYATNYEFVMGNAWIVAKHVYPNQFPESISNKLYEMLSAFYNRTIDPEIFPILMNY